MLLIGGVGREECYWADLPSIPWVLLRHSYTNQPPFSCCCTAPQPTPPSLQPAFPSACVEYQPSVWPLCWNYLLLYSQHVHLSQHPQSLSATRSSHGPLSRRPKLPSESLLSRRHACQTLKEFANPRHMQMSVLSVVSSLVLHP